MSYTHTASDCHHHPGKKGCPSWDRIVAGLALEIGTDALMVLGVILIVTAGCCLLGCMRCGYTHYERRRDVHYITHELSEPILSMTPTEVTYLKAPPVSKVTIVRKPPAPTDSSILAVV